MRTHLSVMALHFQAQILSPCGISGYLVWQREDRAGGITAVSVPVSLRDWWVWHPGKRTQGVPFAPHQPYGVLLLLTFVICINRFSVCARLCGWWMKKVVFYHACNLHLYITMAQYCYLSGNLFFCWSSFNDNPQFAVWKSWQKELMYSPIQ